MYFPLTKETLANCQRENKYKSSGGQNGKAKKRTAKKKRRTVCGAKNDRTPSGRIADQKMLLQQYFKRGRKEERRRIPKQAETNNSIVQRMGGKLAIYV